ncbi:MAG TPA: 3-oxoacyl-ACP reductase [Nocardioidaceae bacterium]
MTTRYQSLIGTPVGQLLAKNLGLPNPVKLERYEEGAPLVAGTVVVGGQGRLTKTVVSILDDLGVAGVTAVADEEHYKGLVFDATGISASPDLVQLQRFFTPLMRRLETNARIVVLGTPPEMTNSNEERVAQRALEGFTRTVAKEIGRGGTVQLVYVAPAADAAVESTLAFLLSAKSAYVSGQVIRIGTHGATTSEPVADWTRPLEGKVALVTGASRGIGEEIARVLHRDGATVVGVDVPQAANELQAVMRDIDGDHLLLDITAKDAPQRIAKHLKDKHGSVDVVVHNAGITRDKMLRNMKEDGWSSVLAVNLTAPERLTAELLDQGLVRPNGRIVAVSSTSGIAGNRGQANYTTSKAGAIGLVETLAGSLEDGITINAVAPGFIQTKMTDAMPLLPREVGGIINSMSQPGQPVDVAEAVAWFANPASTAVNGNVVRVCGQLAMGA